MSGISKIVVDVVAGSTPGADTPSRVLRDSVIQALVEHGHGVLGELDTAEGAQTDVMLCVGECPSGGRDSFRRVGWLVGSPASGPGRWDAVFAATDAQKAALDRRVLSVARPVLAGVQHPRAPADRFLAPGPPAMGLHRLLEVWAPMWARWGLPLSVCGAVRRWIWDNEGRAGEMGDRARAVSRLIDQPGVILHGTLSRGRMGELSERAVAVLVAHDPLPAWDPHVALPWLGAMGAQGRCIVSTPSDTIAQWASASAMVAGWDSHQWVDVVEAATSQHRRAAQPLQSQQQRPPRINPVEMIELAWGIEPGQSPASALAPDAGRPTWPPPQLLA